MTCTEYDIYLALAPQSCIDLMQDYIFDVHGRYIDNLIDSNNLTASTHSQRLNAAISISSQRTIRRRSVIEIMQNYPCSAIPWGCYYIVDYRNTYLVWLTNAQMALKLNSERLDIITTKFSTNLSQYRIKMIEA